MIFGCIPHRVLGRIFIFVLLLFFFLSFFPSLFIYLFIYFSFERWNFLYRSFQQVVSRDYFSGRFQTWRFIYFISSYFFFVLGLFQCRRYFRFLIWSSDSAAPDVGMRNRQPEWRGGNKNLKKKKGRHQRHLLPNLVNSGLKRERER